MIVQILVKLEEEQVRETIDQIKRDLEGAVSQTLSSYRDGRGRHSCVINYEVLVEEVE